MSTAVGLKLDTQWLDVYGPKELEQLIRAVIFHPSVPVVVADGSGHFKEASIGVARILGVPREKLLGQRITGAIAPVMQPELSHLWK